MALCGGDVLCSLAIGCCIFCTDEKETNYTSGLLYLYTHSDYRMTRTSCLSYLYTHTDSDCGVH